MRKYFFSFSLVHFFPMIPQLMYVYRNLRKTLIFTNFVPIFYIKKGLHQNLFFIP